MGENNYNSRDVLENMFIENLVGTRSDSWEDVLVFPSDSLFAVIPEDEILQILDSVVFQCANCGWWYEVSEHQEYSCDHLCENCYIEAVTGEEEEWEEGWDAV